MLVGFKLNKSQLDTLQSVLLGTQLFYSGDWVSAFCQFSWIGYSPKEHTEIHLAKDKEQVKEIEHFFDMMCAWHYIENKPKNFSKDYYNLVHDIYEKFQKFTPLYIPQTSSKDMLEFEIELTDEQVMALINALDNFVDICCGQWDITIPDMFEKMLSEKALQTCNKPFPFDFFAPVSVEREFIYPVFKKHNIQKHDQHFGIEDDALSEDVRRSYEIYVELRYKYFNCESYEVPIRRKFAYDCDPLPKISFPLTYVLTCDDESQYELDTLIEKLESSGGKECQFYKDKNCSIYVPTSRFTYQGLILGDVVMVNKNGYYTIISDLTQPLIHSSGKGTD